MTSLSLFPWHGEISPHLTPMVLPRSHRKLGARRTDPHDGIDDDQAESGVRPPEMGKVGDAGREVRRGRASPEKSAATADPGETFGFTTKALTGGPILRP